MIDWLKSLIGKSEDRSATPGQLSSAQNAKVNDIDLAKLLSRVLSEEGYDSREIDGGIALPSGLAAKVEYLDRHEFDRGAMRTTTRIDCWHLAQIPDGIFEFQHASGLSEEESLINGFRTWAQTDLATLEDALAEEAQTSLVMTMEFPATENTQAVTRRVFMGPYVHRVVSEQANSDCETGCHSFCACCLFTNSIESFVDLTKSTKFYGIRLFASRDADGIAMADCRVNGEDFPLGVEYLKKYVATWPDQGFEFRKQYVVLQAKTSLLIDQCGLGC